MKEGTTFTFGQHFFFATVNRVALREECLPTWVDYKPRGAKVHWAKQSYFAKLTGSLHYPTMSPRESYFLIYINLFLIYVKTKC